MISREEPTQGIHYDGVHIESKNSLITAVNFKRIFQETVNILMASVKLPEKSSSLVCRIKEGCQIYVDTWFLLTFFMTASLKPQNSRRLPLSFR